MNERPDRGEQDSTGTGPVPGTSPPAGSTTGTAPTDPKEALRQVAEAIKGLEQSASKQREISRWATAAVVAVCALAFGGIVVHTFYEEEAPKVDETSALLLAVLLFAPFVRYLRALEFAGAKAEFQENASAGFSGVLAVLKAEHNAIMGIYRDVTKETMEADIPPGMEPTPTDTAAPSVRGGPALRLLRRILWVDDQPEGNAYELDALGKLFDIEIVRTTQDAEILLARGEFDAVISDIVRIKEEQPYQAGQRIATLARRKMSPPLPVFFYTSEEAVRKQAEALTDAGAAVVTASYVDLVRAIRQQARVNFDAVVRNALHEIAGHEGVVGQVDDIDFIVTLRGGRKIAIETPHWLRRPKADALQARYVRLSNAIAEGKVASALLVTQKDLLHPEQKERAPTNVEVVVVDQLPERLAALAGRPEESRQGSPRKV